MRVLFWSLFVICTLGFVRFRVKYTDGVEISWRGWFGRPFEDD